MLILLQINASQIVLVRVPHAMGVFKRQSALERMGSGIRAGLLKNSINNSVKEEESKWWNNPGETDNGTKPKNKLSVLLL